MLLTSFFCIIIGTQALLDIEGKKENFLKNVTGEAVWYPPPPQQSPQFNAPPPPFFNGPVPPYNAPPPPYFQPQNPPYLSQQVPPFPPKEFQQNSPLPPPPPFYQFPPHPQQLPPPPPFPSMLLPPLATDHYYCSAHASFTLVSSTDAHEAIIPPMHPGNDNFNGPNVGIYMPQPPFPPTYQQPAPHHSANIPPPISPIFSSKTVTQQYCRFSATKDDATCESCCKIVGRHYTTSVDEITGILFTFNPYNPPILPMSTHVGESARKKRTIDEEQQENQTSAANLANATTKPPTTTKAPPTTTPPPVKEGDFQIKQCFCCAPRKYNEYI